MSCKERNLNLMKKKIPHFKNEDQEREFWATHDSMDYIDWSKAKRVVFPNDPDQSRKIKFTQGLKIESK